MKQKPTKNKKVAKKKATKKSVKTQTEGVLPGNPYPGLRCTAILESLKSKKKLTSEPKMNPKVKKLWIAALESGRYKQGYGDLCKNPEATSFKKAGGFCCLGVLVDLYLKANKIKRGSELAQMELDNGLLSTDVQHWAGLACSNPMLYDSEDGEGGVAAATCNDFVMLTFKEIAKLIAREL